MGSRGPDSGCPARLAVDPIRSRSRPPGHRGHEGERRGAAMKAERPEPENVDTAPPLLLTSAEAARTLRIGVRALWGLTKANSIPHVRIGRSVRYSPAALRAWIEAGAPTDPGAAERVRSEMVPYRWMVALHEAGHVVVGVALNLDLAACRIDDSAGVVFWTRGAPNSWDRAVCAAAGPLAELLAIKHLPPAPPAHAAQQRRSQRVVLEPALLALAAETPRLTDEEKIRLVATDTPRREPERWASRIEVIEDDARRYVKNYTRDILHLASILFVDGRIDAETLRAAMRESKIARLERESAPPTPARREHEPAPPARHDAPSTSHDAARAIAPRTPRMREYVLNHIRRCGAWGATDFEGGEALGLRSQSYTPRRRELFKAGAVVDSGRRRRTASGRFAVVWLHRDFAPHLGPVAT